MTTPRKALLAIAVLCLGLLGVGLYLQYGRDMLPCPLCIIQRYAFFFIAIVCLIGAFLPRGAAVAASGIAALLAVSGAGVAGWHLWVKAHPTVSCGIDPVEVALNALPTSKLMPFLFQADGMCTTEYPPILGLSIPQWSLVWFVIFAIALGRLIMRRAR